VVGADRTVWTRHFHQGDRASQGLVRAWVPVRRSSRRRASRRAWCRHRLFPVADALGCDLSGDQPREMIDRHQLSHRLDGAWNGWTAQG